MIDWTLPIETDEPNPRSASAVRIAMVPDKYSVTCGGIRLTYDDAGRPVPPVAPHTPNIRNVGTALRTSDEALSRMEALVRRIAAVTNADGTLVDRNIPQSPHVSAEAHAIVAMLPVPVDPDLLEARDIASGFYDANQTLDGDTARLVLAGIKRGRELATAINTAKEVADELRPKRKSYAHLADDGDE